MNAIASQAATPERPATALAGWPMLLVTVATLLCGIAVFVSLLLDADHLAGGAVAVRILSAIGLELLSVLLIVGFFTLQPNEARVLILFGHYRGTVRSSGLLWANPFYARRRSQGPQRGVKDMDRTRPRSIAEATIQGFLGLPTKLSLRAVIFNTETLKVNDRRGNPVEIGAVVVWRVLDTARAVFDVEDYVKYVEVQSEAAIRGIASRYAYDHGGGDESEITLRGGAEEVALALRTELQSRLARAGLAIDDARLTHLAYAPEIAPVMLRRQQAEAVIAARQIIVHNAVGMVQMALRELDEQGVVKLDEERKASMVSNLLVVLCGTSEATPVINTGTLYA